MKKNIVITLGVTVTILLVAFGMSMLNKEATNRTENKNQEVTQKKSSTAERMKDREEIKDPINSKYQSVAVIQIDLNNAIDRGTGFIVGKNALLTNKHVSDSFNEGKKLTVRLKNENGEFTDFKVKNVIPAPDNKDLAIPVSTDLAIVEVEPTDDGKNISDNIDMLEFATLEEINKVKTGSSIYVVGYPGDKEYGTLWKSKGKMLEVGPYSATYDAFISGGNSGSPLLNEENKIIGLVNASTDENDDEYVGYGFLLNEDLLKFIKSNI